MSKRAGIIGGGVIGAGWAARFLLHGWDVAYFDPAPDAATRLEAVLGAARQALQALYEGRLPAPGALTVVGSLAAAADHADWIQESVPEDLATKHRVLLDIERNANPEALIGSSTSGFKPGVLAAPLEQPERFAVCHPFNPVYLLPLVEVVPSATTSKAAVDRMLAALGSTAMKPLVVRREIDAHIADRLLEAVWREALWLVRDGVATTEEIDTVITHGFGPRWAQMGLFETYRIAGGDGGMAHFLEQFGPALAWPWSRLTDVPDMDAALIQQISSQSDAQSGAHSVAELEARRDANLVAIFSALRRTNSAAGGHLNRWLDANT